MDENSTDASGGIFKRMAELRRDEASETLNRGHVELHAASLKACGQMLFHLQEAVDILSASGFEKVFPETNLYTLYDTVKPQRTILKLVKVNEQLNELTRNSELLKPAFSSSAIRLLRPNVSGSRSL